MGHRRQESADAELRAFLAAHPAVPPRTEIPAGAVAGTWRLTAFLGRGGTSEVFRAVHTALPLQAAVKILVRGDAAARVRFDRETQFLFENRNPLFPRFLGSGEYEGRPFIAIELLEPVELPSEDSAVADFILAVADGVATLHGMGFVHRDLKPRNIMRRKNGVPVIIDFGLLKEAERGTAANTPPQTASVVDGRRVGVGTPRNSAPEQFIEGAATPASDIHALGVLADKCFGGRAPRNWTRIIRNATSSLPSQRYASVAAFSRAVRNRHAARRMLAVSVAIAFAAAVFWVLQHFFAAPFPQEMHLGGKRHVFSAPIILESGGTYRVTGPGILDADISSPTNTLLVLKDCVILNRSTDPYPANGLRYRLENGVYLNFKGIGSEPLSVSRREYIEPYDGAFNAVAFDGPDSPEEFRRIEAEEAMRHATDEELEYSH